MPGVIDEDFGEGYCVGGRWCMESDVVITPTP